MEELKNNVFYVGVNDHEVDFFEGQFVVPEGMAYNSYVIKDEKIAVLDTVDGHFAEQWLSNIKEVLGGQNPDYLVIHHMEPDHSACIGEFLKVYPNTKVVGNNKTFAMMADFYRDVTFDKVVVGDGETLSLGKHSLTFVFAPMVHWPEVMVSYENSDKILFSADAFGKFGALDSEEDWACEARRYYFGIVGKYGVQVQNLLKKAKGLDIQMICPLHGPVLKENIGYYSDLYNTWSSYKPENKGVFIAYTSVYGNTKKAVEALAEKLQAQGVEKVSIADLVRDDMYEAVEDAFRYDRLVLATTTYNGGVFPKMHEFICHLTERNYQNRTVAFIENGTWVPLAKKGMTEMLAKCKNLNVLDESVKIISSLSNENEKELDALALALAKN